jgi:acetolactate synthase I/II/III large subunit
MTEMTGGELIARMLENEGVDTMFGIVDGTYLQLCVHAVKRGIHLYTPRHETMGLHMAGAYARLTGKLGVCIASNGPGVANALSGIAVEQVEGNRVLVITSCRRPNITYPDRGGAYQAFDQVGAIRAMSKWSEAATSFDRIGELLRQALRKCYQGRPGVVHLDVPENLINGKGEAGAILAPRQYRRVDPIYPSPDQVERAARMLTEAKLPIIHAGSGVIHADAFAELAQLSELLHAPVTTSWAARAVINESSQLSWPMIHVAANTELRKQADLVLVVGSRLGETDWWGKAPYWKQPLDQTMIQVDIDEENFGRTKAAALTIMADAKVFLAELNRRLRATKGDTQLEPRRKIVSQLAKSRDEDRAKLDKKLSDKASPMLTAHVPAIAQQEFPRDTVTVLDGGNTSVWGNFYHRVNTPNSLIGTASHMGHLGAGMGMALGAAIARPDQRICCIISDGAFGFQPQEVETAIRHDLPVVFLVVCDRQWGMVKMTQSIALKPIKMMIKKSLRPEETINSELGEVRYDKMSEAMGAHSEHVTSPSDLGPAIRRSLAAGRCAVIQVDVDSKKHLWAPGLMHFKAMHQEPKGK